MIDDESVPLAHEDTPSDPFLQKIQDVLSGYVEKYPFDNVAVLLSFLYHLDQLAQGNVEDAFLTWEPISNSLVDEFGGTNCIGAVAIVKTLLENLGIKTELIISPSNRLPGGVSPEAVPFQHAALSTRHPESGTHYLIEAGLGLIIPIPANETSIVHADRIYNARMSEVDAGLRITRPDGKERVFDFIHSPPDGNLDQLVQKPLLSATAGFKIESFDPQGKQQACVKIHFLREEITVTQGQSRQIYAFSEAHALFEREDFPAIAKLLHQSSAEALRVKIEKIVRDKRKVVEMWNEKLQREYYLLHPGMLSPYQTSWDELEKRGYKGGGVVVCFVDADHDNSVLMYRVPEGKAKPHIGRSVGDLNLFVETADPIVKGDTRVSNLEGFEKNLQRAFDEELGVSVPENGVYREVDYGKGVRARCVVYPASPDLLEKVRAHQLSRQRQTGVVELGEMQWVDLTTTDPQALEPNARAILQKMTEEKIF